MKVIRYTQELRKVLTKVNGSIGFVPTMGFLHKGHLSLVARSKAEMDCTVVSIFVNPTQFGPNEDFEAYPRDEAHDLKLLENAGVDYVFIPTVDQIYPANNATDVLVTGSLTKGLCANTRPTHFAGVTNVVSRLFNIVRPDKAFFGQKDAQQLMIIKRMTEDLQMGIEIVGCPIVREPDGLAMSSRNTYLSPEERTRALSISKSLFQVQEMIDSGKELLVKDIKNVIRNAVESSGGVVDYIDVVCPKDLVQMQDDSLIGDSYLVATAIYFGKTRLLDNILRM